MRKIFIAMMIVGSLSIVGAGRAEADEAKGAKSGLYVGLDLVVNIPEQDLQLEHWRRVSFLIGVPWMKDCPNPTYLE